MPRESISLSHEETKQLLEDIVENVNAISCTAEKTFLILAVLVAELTNILKYHEEEQNFPQSLVKAVYEAASLQYIPDTSTEDLCSITIQ